MDANARYVDVERRIALISALLHCGIDWGETPAADRAFLKQRAQAKARVKKSEGKRLTMPPKRKSSVTVKTEKVKTEKVKTEKKPAKPAAKKPAKRAAAEGDAKPKRAKKPRVKAEPGPRTLALPPAAATIGFASGAPRAPVRTGEVRVGPRASRAA